MTVLLIASGLLVITGSVFALVAAIGLLRLPDVYTRMHAAAKAGALGSGLMLIALAFAAEDLASATRAAAGVVFVVLTTPIATHLLARAAYAVGYRLWDGSVLDEMTDKS